MGSREKEGMAAKNLSEMNKTDIFLRINFRMPINRKH